MCTRCFGEERCVAAGTAVSTQRARTEIKRAGREEMSGRNVSTLDKSIKRAQQTATNNKMMVMMLSRRRRRRCRSQYEMSCLQAAFVSFHFIRFEITHSSCSKLRKRDSHTRQRQRKRFEARVHEHTN